jgi:hypothetical protein
MIDTNPHIQLPAIQHAVVLTFGREGVDESEMDDEDICRYINSLLIDKVPPQDQSNYSNIGRGVGTSDESSNDIGDSNKDPWVLLTPQN